MAKKSAAGSGTIRKKTVTRKGKKYQFWEARFTVGTDPGTGKQVQRSISGKTQKEVAQKLKAVTAAIDAGTYQAPSNMTVGQWLDTWTAEYLGGVKPRTVDSYTATAKLWLKPAFGAVKLEGLTSHAIQKFYNGLLKEDGDRKALSPKTIKNINGVFHRALQQAVANGLIRFNPADNVILPRVEKAELHPLDEQQIASFMEAIKGHPLENLFLVTLFTGMREGEVLGLTWDCVDFAAGTITVNKQLFRERDGSGIYHLAETKTGKTRTITPAPYVMKVLKQVSAQQKERKLTAGGVWDNPLNLVFTNETGRYLTHLHVYRKFKQVVASIGCPECRFHDLRHSYAMASLRAGDDIKTVQENLGHSTIAMTMDIYAFVTDRMKQDSAARMERFIQSISS